MSHKALGRELGCGWSRRVGNTVIVLTLASDMDGGTKTCKPIHTKPFNSEDEKQQHKSKETAADGVGGGAGGVLDRDP